MPPKPKRPKVVDLADYQPISQPSVRSGYLWTPAMLRSMQLQADSGDLTRLGDLCEQMIADDRIGELLESLASDVLGCELSFEKTPRVIVGDAEKADDLETDWPIGYDDDELTSLSIWTLVTGIGFGKHERWVESEGRIVPQLKWWHPRQFTFRQPNGATQHWQRQWHVRDHDGNTTPVTPGDGTWVMLTRRGEFRPWANGLWRGLAPWWMLKQYAISDWGVHSEKTSKLVVTAEEGSTSDQRKAIAKYVYEASKDAVISLPVGFDMKLLETAANTREIYDAQIQAANEGFAIAILGQNLSSNVQGGSRAAAEVHERKENRKVRWLGKLLTKGLHDQSLSWWAEYNFGDRSLAPYPHWHTEPPEDYAAKATGLKTLADGLVSLKAAGYKLSTDDLEEDYGVELEELPDPPPEMVAGMPGKPGQPMRGAPAKKPAAKTAGRPVARADAPHFLASGDDPADAQGFIRGQVYVDDLSDKQSELAADALTGFVDRLSAAIDGAEDYEAVREAVIAAFLDEQDPDRIADLVAAGIVMANMAGRNAVQEDLPAEDVQASADEIDPRQLPLFDGAVEHYPAGSSKGGQFKPKSGAAPGTPTKKAAKKVGVKKSGGGGSSGGGVTPAAKPAKTAKPAAPKKAAPKKKVAAKARPAAAKPAAAPAKATTPAKKTPAAKAPKPAKPKPTKSEKTKATLDKKFAEYKKANDALITDKSPEALANAKAAEKSWSKAWSAHAKAKAAEGKSKPTDLVDKNAVSKALTTKSSATAAAALQSVEAGKPPNAAKVTVKVANANAVAAVGLKAKRLDTDDHKARAALHQFALASPSHKGLSQKAVNEVAEQVHVGPQYSRSTKDKVLQKLAPEHAAAAKDWAMRWQSSSSDHAAEQAITGVKQPGTWANAQYHVTQKLIKRDMKALQAKGVIDKDGYVTLYRGVHGGQASTVRKRLDASGKATLDVRSVSSWSERETVAKVFAGSGGAVTKVKVHHSRVFAMHSYENQNTLWGKEGEWVIMAEHGKIQVEVPK